MVTDWPRSRRSRSGRGVTLWMMVCTCAAVLTVLLLGAGPAGAGKPGSWSNVTGDTGTNLTQVDTVRGAGDTLWVAFYRDKATSQDLLVRSITPAGALGALVPVQTGWKVLNNPAIGRLSSGDLRMFFSGIRSTAASDPYSGLSDATSTTGTVWALRATPPVVYDYQGSGATAYAADVDAAVLPSGEAFQAWSGLGSGPVWVHKGYSDAATSQYNYMTQVGGGTGYFAALDFDRKTSALWVAWMVLDGALEGVYVQQVDTATAAPIGSPTRLSGTYPLDMMSSKVPLTGRPGGQGGVFAVYPVGDPTPKTIRLYQLGTTIKAMNVAGGSASKDEAGVAADAKGRVWVFWSENGRDNDTIFAKRSNPGVTRFGRTVSVKTPKGLPYLYHLTGNARDARLDVLAHLSGSGEGDATYHTQVLPGLSAKASPTKVKVRKKQTVTVTVSDAGVPVKGALVRIGGKKGKTNAKGKARIKVGPYKGQRTLTFKVTKSGYSGTSTKVSVRR